MPGLLCVEVPKVAPDDSQVNKRALLEDGRSDDDHPRPADAVLADPLPSGERARVRGPKVRGPARSADDRRQLTDFTAKLIDVYPPSLWYPQGYALNLTDSIARLRYRNGRERGKPMQVTLTLYPTSNLFMPGHRIRLDVSSSNFPRFDVKRSTRASGPASPRPSRSARSFARTT
jgi:putative CocE/NonD family hydrolase